MQAKWKARRGAGNFWFLRVSATPKTNFDLKISVSQIALAVGGQIL